MDKKLEIQINVYLQIDYNISNYLHQVRNYINKIYFRKIYLEKNEEKKK